MSPPRALPPGHFVGDGHNHGGETGNEVHNHGHDHAHESPEQHLHHMQEHQEARGRATLEEFQQAARETAQLSSGRRSESAPPSQARSEAGTPARESAGARAPASEPRQAANPEENPRQNAENSRPPSRDFSGLARMFSANAAAASPTNRSAWAEALRQQFRPPRPAPEQATSRHSESAGANARASSSAGAEGGAALAVTDHEAPSPLLFSQALAKLQTVLQEASPDGAGLAMLPPEAAEALAVLFQGVLASPELLASLPPGLASMVQSLLGPSGAILLQTSSKLMPGNLAGVFQALLGRMAPGSFSVERGGEAVPFRGLGLMLGIPLFGAPVAAKFPPGLLQRFEKALLQFLRLFGAKADAKPTKEAPILDKALLEALAALVAAEEKRRKEKERLRGKKEASPALRAKPNPDFRDEGSGEFEVPEELWMNPQA